ncbi:MAG: hypothetical protein WKF88_03200 [Ferruginibacter sp.]
MKRIIMICSSIFFVNSVNSQNIEIEKKSGLVKVDGKESFYLIKVNKSIVNFDLSLQNLEKKQLAFFATRSVDEIPYNLRPPNAGAYFLVTFSETGNTANVFPESMGSVKDYARQIVQARLINESKIDMKAERAFVVSHNGNIFKESESVNIIINNNSANNNYSSKSDILIKENNIYNSQQLIGSFKKSTNDAITTANIYNKSGVKIAAASHTNKNMDSDWTVVVGSNTYQLLYNETTPIENLIKFLIEKNLFE